MTFTLNDTANVNVKSLQFSDGVLTVDTLALTTTANINGIVLSLVDSNLIATYDNISNTIAEFQKT